MSIQSLLNEARELTHRAQSLMKERPKNPFARYESDPVGYSREVLGVRWWAKQCEIARKLTEPPYRVLVKASHSVGKTHLAGGLVNWWYDTYDPGLVVSTAPTDLQVRDLLWKEVRVQRGARGGFRGDKAPRLESSPDHWAFGFTAKTGTAFQGRHDEHILFVFDEAVEVAQAFWNVTETMFQGRGHGWLAIFNPTDTASQPYQEEMLIGPGGGPKWHVVTMSSLDHPNIAAELMGLPKPYPGAITLEQLETMLRDWCQVVRPGEEEPGDIEWRPGTGKFLRPGPLAECRVLGRWPSQGSYGVWSESIWSQCMVRRDVNRLKVPEVGIDVARFGDDWTTGVVRWDCSAITVDTANKRDTVWSAYLGRRLAEQAASMYNSALVSNEAPISPKAIRIKVDDDGIGGAVVDQLRADGYMAVPVNAQSAPCRPMDYPDKRSELWFQTAEERAKKGLLDLTRLPPDVQSRLRQQAMAPRWKLDSKGRRVVERKEDVKERVGRSPDDMDALNLAFYEHPSWPDIPGDPRRVSPVEPHHDGAQFRRKLLGR